MKRVKWQRNNCILRRCMCMKSLFDWRTERRDQVLALLPVEDSPFQAQYSGPFEVVKQVNDLNYLIAIPQRRKSTQLCHINLLKPYYCRSHEALDVKSEVKHALVVENTSAAHLGIDEGVSPQDDTVLVGH